jgi:DNA-binding XRE family transcriptional regulator
MSASAPIKELREKAAGLLVARLKEGREDKRDGRLSVFQISEALGISRQAVYDIKNGEYCPSLSLVHRMCKVWDDKFDLGGIVIDRTTPIPKKRQATPLPAETQPGLFEALEHLDIRHFEVIATKPMGRALEITLRLTIPEQKTGTTSN